MIAFFFLNKKTLLDKYLKLFLKKIKKGTSQDKNNLNM